MARPDCDTIVKRAQQLENTHQQWRGLWQELTDYILPRKNDIYQSRSVGERKTEKLFDSTAVHSNEILASSMAGSLTNQGTKWFSLKLRNEAINDVWEVGVWLQACAHQMHRAIQQSNFASEVLEVYLDLGAVGTACLLIEEKVPSANYIESGVGGFQGIEFKACNTGEFMIDEGPDGMVDTVFRKVKMTARDIMTKWPDFTNDRIQQNAKNGVKQKENVLHCVFPRTPGTDTERFGAKGLPFASYYILEKEKKYISESGFHENPYCVPRWTKASHEVYGRGPGTTALPDIKTLNKVKELSLRTWAKVLDPPLALQHDGVIGKVRLTPGGITYTRGAPREMIESLRIDARFDVSQLKEEELRGSIRNIFWSNQLELQQGPQMTAHEVMVRHEMMQRLLGPTLGRLETELLGPIIERVFGIMFRAGALPEPPPTVIEYSQQGGKIDIEYESPIARAQRSGDAMAIQSTFDFVTPFAEVRPDILDNFDLDEAARTIARVRSVPATVMRSRDQVHQDRAARAEAQKQQAKMQEMEAMATAMGKAAPMVKADAEARKEGAGSWTENLEK